VSDNRGDLCGRRNEGERTAVSRPYVVDANRVLLLHEGLGRSVDRSGGLITFESESTEEAERLVADDPFIREDLFDRHWVKVWVR